MSRFRGEGVWCELGYRNEQFFFTFFGKTNVFLWGFCKIFHQYLSTRKYFPPPSLSFMIRNWIRLWMYVYSNFQKCWLTRFSCLNCSCCWLLFVSDHHCWARIPVTNHLCYYNLLWSDFLETVCRICLIYYLFTYESKEFNHWYEGTEGTMHI